MNQSNLEMLAQKVGVPIKKLSAEILDQLKGPLQAQFKTADYKKHVYIVKRLIFKGPYERDDHFLIKNLVYTYAVQILEEALQLPERQRGSLRWEYLGYGEDNQYYLVSRNVGKWKNIPFEVKSSKMEKNVKLVPRGAAVLRLREVENNGQLTAGIKSAYLQHLYLRYLLGIGDSGPQNVLIRQDYKSTGRLVAGIDLELRRDIKVKTSRLDHLFNTENKRKEYQILYGPYVRKIKLLSYSQLDQRTLDRLSAVGIDLKRLKENVELWDRLN